MAEQITLSPVGSLIDTTTAQTTINNNFTIIQDTFTDVLSLTGVEPNAMEENLDMNSKQILNLPAPATLNSPARLTDLIQANGGGTITNIPAGGTTGQILAKNSNADYDIKWEGLSPDDMTGGLNITTTGNNPTVIATVSNPVFSTSVTTPRLINTGTLTLPTVTDTLVARTTTDTLTNKTLTAPVIDHILTSTTPNTSITGILTNNQGATAGIGAGFAVIGDTFSPSPFPTHGQVVLCAQSNPTTIQGGNPAAAATITLPNQTDTIVGRTTTDTLTGKTISGASNTLTVLGGSQISGNIPVSNLNSGSGASSSTFWRGDATWAAPPTGSIIALETLTASNSASLSSTVSWAGFSAIEVNFLNIVPVTTSVQFNAQAVTAGGTISTGYVNQVCNISSTTVGAITGITTAYEFMNALANTANFGLSGTVRFYNIQSTTQQKGSQGTYMTPSPGFSLSSGSLTVAAALTGMTFFMSSGNISTGLIKIYGVV